MGMGFVYSGQGYLIPVGMVAGDCDSFTQAVNTSLDMSCDDIHDVDNDVLALEYVSVDDLDSATLDGEDYSDPYGVFVGYSDGADETSAVVNAILAACGVDDTRGFYGRLRVECVQ